MLTFTLFCAYVVVFTAAAIGIVSAIVTLIMIFDGESDARENAPVPLFIFIACVLVWFPAFHVVRTSLTVDDAAALVKGDAE